MSGERQTKPRAGKNRSWGIYLIFLKMQFTYAEMMAEFTANKIHSLTAFHSCWPETKKWMKERPGSMMKMPDTLIFLKENVKIRKHQIGWVRICCPHPLLPQITVLLLAYKIWAWDSNSLVNSCDGKQLSILVWQDPATLTAMRVGCRSFTYWFSS